MRNYAYIAIKLNKVDLVNQLIENSSSEPIKKLINRMANREAVSTDEIIKISENEIPKELTDILQVYKFLILMDNFITNDKKPNFDLFSSLLNVQRKKGVHREDAILIAIQYNYNDIEKKLLGEFSPKEIANQYTLRNLNAQLNSMSENLVEEITNYEIADQEKSNLHLAAATANLANEDKEKTQFPIEEIRATEEVVEEDEDNQIIETAIITSALINDQQKVTHYSKMVDEANIQEIKDMFGKDELLSQESSRAKWCKPT